MNTFSDELRVAEEVVAACANHLSARAQDVQTKQKIGANGLPELVTNLDLELNELGIARLRAAFPDDSVVGEEGRVGRPSVRYWILDPIDGTRSFVDERAGAAIVLTCVANNQPVVSVVRDISNAQTFTIVGGVIRDDEGEALDTSVAPQRIVMWNPYLDDDALYKALAEQLGLGAAVECESTSLRALAIAQGAACLLVSLPSSSKIWDSAAAIQIFEAAGGTYTDFTGAPIRLNPAQPVNVRGALGTRGIDHKAALRVLKPLLQAT